MPWEDEYGVYGAPIDYDALVVATSALLPGGTVSASQAEALGVGYRGGAIAAILSSGGDETESPFAGPLNGSGGYGLGGGGGPGVPGPAVGGPRPEPGAFDTEQWVVQSSLADATAVEQFQGGLTAPVFAAVPAVTTGVISPGGGLSQPGHVSTTGVAQKGVHMAGFDAGSFLGAALGGAAKGFVAGGPIGALMGAVGGGFQGFAGAPSGVPFGAVAGGPAPGGVAKQWMANGRVFYRLSDGRITTQKNNGVWKTWRPRRNIVISSNPRINSARRVIKLARRLERKLPAQRRPRARE